MTTTLQLWTRAAIALAIAAAMLFGSAAIEVTTADAKAKKPEPIQSIRIFFSVADAQKACENAGGSWELVEHEHGHFYTCEGLTDQEWRCDEGSSGRVSCVVTEWVDENSDVSVFIRASSRDHDAGGTVLMVDTATASDDSQVEQPGTITATFSTSPLMQPVLR